MANLFQTEKISKLGFGYMRLPRKNDAIDMEHVRKMADAYIESGGNYFDAAYVYDGAEAALRESVIKRHPREGVNVATKLNLGPVNTREQMREQLNTSLDRLGCDYVDFYLLHGLGAGGAAKAEEIGAWDFLRDLKKEGVIRHMGFSFHDSAKVLDDILGKHPEAEFVQLQINYLDWEDPKLQSRLLYETAHKHGVPIIVMEPVKGGKLASDSSPIAQILKSANPGLSTASWALRFAAGLEGVAVVLSGMSNLEQTLDNIETFSDLKPLSADESATIGKAVKSLDDIPRVACTECRYCIAGCPSKLKIPELIRLYNDYLVHKTATNLAHSYRFCTMGGGKAGECVSCLACEGVCPQKLPIAETMGKISALFD